MRRGPRREGDSCNDGKVIIFGCVAVSFCVLLFIFGMQLMGKLH